MRVEVNALEAGRDPGVPGNLRKPKLQGHGTPVPESDCPIRWIGSGGRCARTSISIGRRVGEVV
jgi:hypothetical protein